jgi:hypothetical protein
VIHLGGDGLYRPDALSGTVRKACHWGTCLCGLTNLFASSLMPRHTYPPTDRYYEFQ